MECNDVDFVQMIKKMFEEDRITEKEKEIILYKADIDNDYMCGDAGDYGFWD